MLTVDLARAPLSASEIHEQRAALETQERLHIAVLGTMMLFMVAMVWAYMLLSPPKVVVAVGLVLTVVTASCKVGDLLTLAAKFASLQPANPVELVQVPTLVQQSPLCASYVARVAACNRPLIGLEFRALVLEAGRATRAAVRRHDFAGAAKVGSRP